MGSEMCIRDSEATFFVRTEPLQPLAWGGGAALILLLALASRRFGQPARPQAPQP